MAEENGVWRTVRGRRVFIRDGEDLASAMQRSGKFNNLKRADVFKGKQELKNRELHRQTRDMENAHYNNRYKFGEKYWSNKWNEARQFEREGKELIDKYDEGYGETKVTKMVDYNAKNRAERFRNYNTETDATDKLVFERERMLADLSNNSIQKENLQEKANNVVKNANPRKIADYYLKKGEFEKFDKTIKEYGFDDEKSEFLDGANSGIRNDYKEYRNRATGMTKQEETNWREQIKKNNEQAEKDIMNIQNQINDYRTKSSYSDNAYDRYKYLKEADNLQNKYYERFRENERANAKIKQEAPNEKYENVEAYAGYKDKFNSTWGDDGSGTKTVSAKMYTNDEFMEHLEDANWHTERRMLENANLTNAQLGYVKDNTNVSAWSADLDKAKVERLIKEAKEKYPVKDIKEKVAEYKNKKYGIKEAKQEEEYQLYKKAKENPDSIGPMTEWSTDWEALDKKYARRYAKENPSSYTKSGSLNYKQFGIVSTPEASFSDDGTRFNAYRLPNGMEMTVAKDSDDIYLSVRHPYNKEVSYEEYSSLPHYRDLDMYNGVRKDSVDLNKVIESSNAYLEEYNALLKKKGISADTRSINERRLDNINSQIEMAKSSYKYHNENQDYTRWRYHRNEANRAYKKQVKLEAERDKIKAEIERFKNRKR